MVQKRPRQHKEGNVLQIKKKEEVVESYTNTSPTDHSASNLVSTLVRSPGNRGTKREAEKTTTQKDTEGPQVCTYCENHSQLR